MSVRTILFGTYLFNTPIHYSVFIFPLVCFCEPCRFDLVSVGINAVCATDYVTGHLRCWGQRQFNNPSFANFTLTSLKTQDGTICAITSDGIGIGWPEPYTPPPNTALKAITLASNYGCGIGANNTIIVFYVVQPWQSPPDDELMKIDGGEYHVCGLRMDGSPVCWGQLDQVPLTPPSESGFVEISTGAQFACALRANKTVVCWGDSSQYSPIPDGEIESMDAGRTCLCVVMQDNQLQCAGHAVLVPSNLTVQSVYNSKVDPFTIVKYMNNTLGFYGIDNFGRKRIPSDCNCKKKIECFFNC